MRKNRQVARFALAASAVAAGLFGIAPPAQAAERNGTCDEGEFCYYYNSNSGGSVSDFRGSNSVPNYGTSQPTCYDFKGAGAGRGLCVKNNAASVWNRTTGSVTVYYNSGYAGASQTINAGGRVNLNATLKNQNASHRVGGGSQKPPESVHLTRELNPGGSIKSPNGRYTLSVNPWDGDVEVRAIASDWTGRDRLMWSTALRCGDCKHRLVMQADGNLVLYGTTARWESNTDGNPGAQLALQNDGNVVIYKGGMPIWNTRTARYMNYDSAVDLIRQEMTRNAAHIRTYNRVYRKVVFGWNVREDGPWDHKPQLKDGLHLRTTDSYHLDVRRVPRTALYYDFFSNLHYGYVGRAAGFTERELIYGSKGLPLAGNPDPNDDVAIRAGVRLSDSGGTLTNAAIQQSIEASVSELRNRGSNQVRTLAW